MSFLLFQGRQWLIQVGYMVRHIDALPLKITQFNILIEHNLAKEIINQRYIVFLSNYYACWTKSGSKNSNSDSVFLNSCSQQIYSIKKLNPIPQQIIRTVISTFNEC